MRFFHILILMIGVLFFSSIITEQSAFGEILKIIKITNGTDGTFQFNITRNLDGSSFEQSITTVGGDGTTDYFEVFGENYTIFEIVPDNAELVEISCNTGFYILDEQNAVGLTIPPAFNATCTFVNNVKTTPQTAEICLNDWYDNNVEIYQLDPNLWETASKLENRGITGLFQRHSDIAVAAQVAIVKLIVECNEEFEPEIHFEPPGLDFEPPICLEGSITTGQPHKCPPPVCVIDGPGCMDPQQFLRVKIDSIALKNMAKMFAKQITLDEFSQEVIMMVNDDQIEATMFPESISPLKQLRLGAPPGQVICKEGFDLIFKHSGEFPACVKSSSVEKLISRGWTR